MKRHRCQAEVRHKAPIYAIHAIDRTTKQARTILTCELVTTCIELLARQIELKDMGDESDMEQTAVCVPKFLEPYSFEPKRIFVFQLAKIARQTGHRPLIELEGHHRP